MSTRVLTHLGVAHPWLCDANTHLNTRNYVGAFDDAAQHFFASLGFQPGGKIGWADVSQEIVYLREVPQGTLFTVDCEVTKVGRSSISYRQRLLVVGEDEPAATVAAVTVQFDLENRRSVQLPEAFAARARACIATETISLPSNDDAKSSGL